MGDTNIFNYLNPGDFVTEVAPADWGYVRYGRDIVFSGDTLEGLAKALSYSSVNADAAAVTTKMVIDGAITPM